MDSYYCIEDVSGYLNTTNGLFELLSQGILSKSRESVATRDALLDLFDNHKPAYNLLRNYGHICDCLLILQDRVQQAVAMLERITEARLKRIKEAQLREAASND